MAYFQKHTAAAVAAPAEALHGAAAVLAGTATAADAAASSGDDTVDCTAVASLSGNHCTRTNY